MRAAKRRSVSAATRWQKPRRSPPDRWCSFPEAKSFRRLPRRPLPFSASPERITALGNAYAVAQDYKHPIAVVPFDALPVCDNPGLIFECPVPTIRAASGSAATLVPASGDIAAGAADDAYNAAVLVLKSKAAGSSNSDKPGTRRAVTDYAKSGTVLTLETGGTPAAGDEYELYPALGSAVCALNAKATALVVSATGATAVRCIGHDYERHTIRCIAAAHTLAAKS